MKDQPGFTLIELLVVVATIAVLAAVVIIVLNPAELLRQSRDANRLSDIKTISSALNIYSEDVAGGLLGNAATTYISVPDPTATSTAGDQCQGLNMSSLSSGTWQCAASTTYRLPGGTGWIPVNLGQISSGNPLGEYPVDPTNQTSSDLFYTYETNGSLYELTAKMESLKYASTSQIDGGQYADLYENGTSLALAVQDFGGGGGGSSNIALDATSSYLPSGSGTNFSWNQKVNGPNEVLVVTDGDSCYPRVDISSITYDSSPLTLAVAKSAGTSYGRSEIWYIVNPPTGTNSIQVTFGSTQCGINTGYAAAAFTGVDQATPIDATSTARAMSAAASTTIVTGNNNDFVVDAMNIINSNGIPVAGSGQTVIYKYHQYANDSNAASYKGPVSPAGSTDMSWSGLSSDFWDEAAISLKPAGS